MGSDGLVWEWTVQIPTATSNPGVAFTTVGEHVAVDSIICTSSPWTKLLVDEGLLSYGDVRIMLIWMTCLLRLTRKVRVHDAGASAGDL